jgi:hypothetical protein
MKGNMDAELTVHAMELAEHIDHLVLFSGAGGSETPPTSISPNVNT